jgi:hypothetical protein
VINICDRIIVQSFKNILRIVVHFEIRKRVHTKLTIFSQNDMNLLCIVMYQEREKLVHSGLQFFYCEQPYFHIGMGSERHNFAYCDLVSLEKS